MDREVQYYLDWINNFVQGIEDERAQAKEEVSRLGASLPEHPQADWLIKQSTWAGVGVLKFKAENPDWERRYLNYSKAILDYDPLSDIDAVASNPVPLNTIVPKN